MRAIKNLYSSDIEQGEKLRNGTLLVKTANKKLTKNVSAITAFDENININVTQWTLNISKGIIITIVR